MAWWPLVAALSELFLHSLGSVVNIAGEASGPLTDCDRKIFLGGSSGNRAKGDSTYTLEVMLNETEELRLVL